MWNNSGKPCPENVAEVRKCMSAARERMAESKARAKVNAATRMRDRYQFLRAHGLCVRCKNTAMDGKSLCADCYMYDKQRKSGVQFLPKEERTAKRQEYCDRMRIAAKTMKRAANGHFIKDETHERTA